MVMLLLLCDVMLLLANVLDMLYKTHTCPTTLKSQGSGDPGTGRPENNGILTATGNQSG